MHNLCDEYGYAQSRFALQIDNIKDLPHEYLYDLKQDADGFLWITSEDGLVRFDGSTCVKYSNTKMSSQAGSYINFDYKNRPWYCNFDGQFFYVDNDSLILADLPDNNGLNFKIKSDSLFYFHKDSLILYDIKKDKLHRIAQLSVVGAATFNEDFLQLYIFVDNAIALFDYSGNEIGQYRFDEVIFPYIMKVKNEYLYAGHKNNSIFIKNYNNGSPFILAEFPINTQIQNVVLSNDKIHICTKNGMLIYNTKTKLTDHFLPLISVTNYFNDSYYNEWVSSTSGLYLLSGSRSYFEYELANPFFQFHHIDSTIFLSDENGHILYFDKNKNKPVSVYQNPSKERIYSIIKSPNPDFSNQLSNAESYPIISHQFSFEGDTYFICRPSIKSTQILDHKYIAVAISGVVGLFRYGHSEVYSLWDHMYRDNYVADNKSEISPMYSSVRGKHVAYNRNNLSVYFGTNIGIYATDSLSNKEILYQGNKIYTKKIISLSNAVLLLNNNGQVFIINSNNEIEKLSLWTEDYPIIDMVHRNGELIFWNKYNIYKCHESDINAHTPLAEYEKINTGILPSRFSSLTFDEHSLYLIYKNKLITLPIHSEISKHEPVFYFEYFIMDEHKIFDEKTIELSSINNNIAIKYSITDFNQSISEMAYRLNKGTWNSVPLSERLLKFDALAAGNYEVEFSVNGKIQAIQLFISVPKPWYNQLWFYVSILAASVLIVILYYRYIIKNHKKENLLLLEKTQLQNDLRQSLLSSIKSQMNPHFLFNALNTIQSYIITEDKDKASTYLSKYSRLTRKILEMSDSEFITLESEIEAIVLYIDLEIMRFPDIKYNIDVQKNINIHNSYLPSMIIQPFVENAIKHGLLHKIGDKKLSIDITQKDQDLTVVIRDNGIGRQNSEALNKAKNKNHNSFATQANLKRVELLNLNRKDIMWYYNDLKDNFGNSLGTEIVLTIPIKKIENDQSNHS